MPKFYDQFLSAGTDLLGNSGGPGHQATRPTEISLVGMVGDTPIGGLHVPQVTSPAGYWTNDVAGQPVDPWSSLKFSKLALVWRAGVGLRAFVYGQTGLDASNVGTLTHDHHLNDAAINSATALTRLAVYSWPASGPPVAGTPSLLVYARNQAGAARSWAITSTSATAF